MFVKILNPLERDKIVNDFLRKRKQIRHDLQQEKLNRLGYQEETEKLFRPITSRLKDPETNKILDRISDNEKLIASNQAKIYQRLSKPPALTGSPTISVSNLIQQYLSSNEDRSSGGHSIRYNPNENIYTIGNSKINFNENVLEIAGKRYEATKGLMELLTKKDPNTELCFEDDYVDYKQILMSTNALYRNFDASTRRVNADRSKKWDLITTQLFPNLIKKKGGKLNIVLLPSDPTDLIESLRLSFSSYKAGNNAEFNKIHSILDQLVKKKIITANQYLKIIQNHNFLKP